MRKDRDQTIVYANDNGQLCKTVSLSSETSECFFKLLPQETLVVLATSQSDSSIHLVSFSPCIVSRVSKNFL